ncbi:MAG: cytochrome-c peroxidase [Flavobacteriales bacterium]
MNRTCLCSLFVVSFLLIACSKERTGTPRGHVLDLPETLYNYAEQDLPPHFSESTALNLFENLGNHVEVSNEGATLGRVLFYDVALSANNSVSCASCHQQEFAFSDPRNLSLGHNSAFTARHSMSLENMLWERRFFWDNRTVGLTNQILQPIQDRNEMGMNLDSLEQKIQGMPVYEDLFIDAFGDSLVTSGRISDAIAQFCLSMISYQSKYDDGLYNDFVNFSESEKRGKDLFFNGETRCNQCHMTALFCNPTAVYSGLELDDDLGLYNETGNTDHIGVFQIPSLRNIEVTAPYMHDARFKTLDEVLEFYNHGVQAAPNLDDRITANFQTGGTPLQLNLSEQDKQDLIAFLKTLTDNQFLTDNKFSNPFR